jgi:hypothetical protein
MHNPLECQVNIPEINHPSERLADESMLREIEDLRQDVMTLKRQLNSTITSWFSSNVLSAYVRLKKYFRNGPRPGTQRLEWICVSGFSEPSAS